MTDEVAVRAMPAKLGRVPAFPPIAARLLAMFAQESVQLGDIAGLIARDPTFAARILQCANSVEFGLRCEITNILQALTMLGLDRAQRVTLSIATAAYTRPTVRAAQLQRCWKHTVACAILAQEIAHASGCHVDQAYTAGILHDIGRLGLLVAYPQEYETVVRVAAERSLDLLDYEREHFGVDHAEAGRYLAERWKLPEVFRLIAGRHHDRLDGAELDLLSIVHCACRAADALGFDVTRPLRPTTFEETLGGLPPRAIERLLADPDRLKELVEQQVLLYETDAAPPSLKPASRRQTEGTDELEKEFTAEIPAPEAPSVGAPARWLVLAAGFVLILLLALLVRE